MIHKILITIMLMLCTVSTAFAQKRVPLKFEAISSQEKDIPEYNIKWKAELKAKGENMYTLTLKITNEGEGTYILFGQSIDQNVLKKNYSIKYDKFFSGDFEESQTQRKKQRVTTQTGNLRTNDPFKFLKRNETVEICYENIENEVSDRELKVACYTVATKTEKKWFGVSREWNILQERRDITFSLDVKIPVLPPTPVRDLILEDLEKETTDLLSELKKVKICTNPKHKGGQSGQEKPHRDKIDTLKLKIKEAKKDKDNAEKYDELISRLDKFTFRTYDCGRHDPHHECGCGKDCSYCNMSWKGLLDKINQIGTAITNAKDNKTEIEKQKRIARRLRDCADNCKDRKGDSDRRTKFYKRINQLLQ